MSNGTHIAPRAERRRVERNTPVGDGVGAAEETLAGLIGQAVAVHLAKMLGPVLQQLQVQYCCVVCATEAKRGERAHEIAVANATAAAEPLPDVPRIGVSHAFTIGPDGPVCWAHFEPGE